MTYDPFTGQPIELTYRQTPPRPMTDRPILMALCLLVVLMALFVWHYGIQDAPQNTCQVQAWTTKDGRGERVLVCSSTLQFDRLYITPVLPQEGS